MLKIAETYMIEGVTIYGDTDGLGTYYMLPQQPRYRLDANGDPVFKFLKYRFPVDRPDGLKGGGFLIFDAEFVVPEEKIEPIKQQLVPVTRAKATADGVAPPPVTIGTITYTDAHATVNVLNTSKQL